MASLRRTPVFAVAAILTLALGTGAVATTWTIVHGVLLAPLSYHQPDRLMSVGLDLHGTGVERVDQPPALYLTYRRLARRVRDVGFYRTGNGNIWTNDGEDASERVTAAWITASTIPLLGVKPQLGRSFRENEDLPNAAGAVILSDALWRSRFGASPDVLGKKLNVNSVVREIIGVMPASFSFPSPDTRLWLPSRIDLATATAGNFAYSGVGRLASGATPSEAQQELNGLMARVAESYPRLESGTATAQWLEEARPTAIVTPLRDAVTSGIAGTLWILAAAAGLVLLVAWGNIVNLMLIRADGRQLELAVREALGASWLRIVAHLFGEALVLTATAGVIALVAAWGAVRALVAFGPADVPRLAEVAVGPATVAVVAIISLVGALVCGTLPAIRMRRGTLSINLRDGRGATTGRARRRLRASIAAGQIAIALAVTAGSALLLRTFLRLYQERPGFDATNVMTVWTQLPFARYDDSASVRFYARLTDAVRQLPGVRAAGVTTQLPLGAGETREQSFRVEGEGRTLSLPTHVVDDGYFSAMTIPLLAGPGFDQLGAQRAGGIIVSARAAMTIWSDPRGNGVIGRRLTLAPSGPTYTVVGVVGDVRDHDLATPPSPTIYLPQVVPLDRVAEPAARRTMALVVRTSGSEAQLTELVPAIREVVRDLDPAVPIFNVAPMTEVIRASTARLSLMLTLMGAAAAITLVLGTIGLYGVIGYMVALRTREFGVRIALGADPAGLARTVAMGGLGLVGAGVAGGWLLYGLAAPFLRGYLYGVAPTDPITLGAATLALAATASVASWIPARRAARVDPMDALRAEH